jgi:L-asparagine transporter-like permease
MYGMFDGLAWLALIGVVAIVALILAAPFALWWLFHHVSIAVR